MPFFVVGPPPFGAADAGVRGPFETRRDAETAREAEDAGRRSLMHVVETVDRAAAEALVRQAFSPSPDA